MPEGPSLVIAKEDLIAYKGKKVQSAFGIANVEMDMLTGQKLIDIKTWGKHLLFCFKGFTIRIHLLMFGSYEIDEPKKRKPKIAFVFPKSTLYFYTCAVKMIEEPLNEVYDWRIDILSRKWDPTIVRKKVKEHGKELIADLLLDQDVFSGVGNIIKNEVLYRSKIHPASIVSEIPPRKLGELIAETRKYGFEFLKWKKTDVLKKHWQAYTKKVCERDGNKLTKTYLGKGKRRCFFCDVCQVKYH